jgi:hypothetical protein
MRKYLYGVVSALPQDEEYGGVAHLWIRDAESAYWFSLTRAVDSDDIEVKASDQLTYVGADLSVTLSSTVIAIKVRAAAARALDGYFEYAIKLHPESDDLALMRETLEVIFRGKVSLVIDA